MIYGNVSTSDVRIKNFDDYIAHKARLIEHYGFNTVHVKENGVSGLHYGDLIYGEEYFVGKQYFNIGERLDEKKTQEYPYGVYRLVRSYSTMELLKDTTHDRLVFRNKGGREIDIRPQSCILSKERIVNEQQQYGFFYPEYLKKAWPDLAEDYTHIPDPGYELGIEPGVRNYIDAFLTLIIWILGIIVLSGVKGGQFSFNFWGSTAYYLWIVVGAIVVMARFTRKRRF